MKITKISEVPHSNESSITSQFFFKATTLPILQALLCVPSLWYSDQSTKKEALEHISTICKHSGIVFYNILVEIQLWVSEHFFFLLSSSITPEQLLVLLPLKIKASLETSLTFKELLQGLIFSHHIHEKPAEVFCCPTTWRAPPGTNALSSRWL